MKSICRVLALMIPLAFPLSAHADTAHDLNEAAFWLEGKTRATGAGVTSDDARRHLGIRACRKRLLSCFWTRDYAYMLEGCPEAFTNAELKTLATRWSMPFGTYDGRLRGRVHRRRDGTQVL